ncbi:serine/threonine protein kinase [Ktedonospora formicarum]|uniref:non-specific serine/threonine protein kinase n=1 Tax=Ktedonospora formicarum TaxID=2778364 RepID=A0A8J3I5M5_9CHLR|nr:serine/threonine-protein kinase [Ktedonospora formicarum]GHO45829.1 hypothetical protein KSX_39920 [Ktedonospora formicarum]
MVDRTGQQLGNYILTQLLGEGGFAEVYHGEHIYLKTPAAIKVLHTKLSGQDDTESFLHEAQFIARLTHPNIVRVLDFGLAEKVPFLVMDYAPQGTLRQRYPRGTRLPLATMAPYVKQVASALQYAHDERLVHRDIKPENMLLGRQNEVLLSDFGIALVAQSSRYQSTQDVIGTVAYMSPEQIQGKPRPASDQYSLGIVVYEWLTGERPFHGSFTELCTQHMFATVPPIREKLPDIPPHVEQVITTALAKDPKQRFGSVKAFATALEQASQSQAPAISVTSSPGAPPVQPTLPAQAGQQQPVTLAQSTPAMTPPSVLTPAANFPHLTPSAQVSATSLATPQGPASIPAQPSAWVLTGKQFIALIIGILLTGVFEVFGYQVSYFLGLAVALALSLFFATKFGPWVGIATSFAPVLVDMLLYQFSSVPSNMLVINCIAAILAGFIAGLAFVSTRGNYRSAKAIGIAIVWSLLSLLVTEVGDLLTYGGYLRGNIDGKVLSLVLLVIILLIANLFGKQRNQQVR